MSNNINKIVIVGGGSAGWMTASTLIKYYPQKEIILIESPNIPIIGVGESTIGGLKTWIHALGIDEKDFMKYTDASYKMSIKFTNFYKKDSEGFHYPFGIPFYGHFGKDGPQVGPDDMLQLWQIKKAKDPSIPVQDYCRTFWSTMPLIENNKFSMNEKGLFDGYYPETNVVYHFDAVKFGLWLKEKYAIPKGVKHIISEVVDVSLNENGIDYLTLSNGQNLSSDLFIDCTGFKSILLSEKMNEPFISYNDIIPNNRAWAAQVPYINKEKEIEPFTNCTAIENGWCWNIPLWSRLGTGYVYSDKYVTPEEAKEQYKNYLMSDKMVIPRTQEQVDSLEFKDIKMRIGIHNRTWVKNVVAIGLSAGFIEPLESNGLFSVHQFLFKLVDALNRGPISQFDRDGYNLATKSIFDFFAHFVALHYALSHRTDTKYWQDIQNKEYDKEILNTKYENNSGFAKLARTKAFSMQHNSNNGIHCIATGMNYGVYGFQELVPNPIIKNDPMKEILSAFNNSTKMLQLKWKSEADNCLTLYQYLKKQYNED